MMGKFLRVLGLVMATFLYCEIAFATLLDVDGFEPETADLYDNYPSGGGTCVIIVVINLDQNFRYERDARSHCSWVGGLFGNGCSVRSLGYGRGWGAFYNKEFRFSGQDNDWGRSRDRAFTEYRRWSDDFGFGRNFEHRVSFDKCGTSY